MSDTRDKAAREHFESTTGGHWAGWPDSQQEDALQDFIAGWDAAVAARPLPDRETVIQFIHDYSPSGCAGASLGRNGIPLASIEYTLPGLADAVLSLFTTDTTEENPNGTTHA